MRKSSQAFILARARCVSRVNTTENAGVQKSRLI